MAETIKKSAKKRSTKKRPTAKKKQPVQYGEHNAAGKGKRRANSATVLDPVKQSSVKRHSNADAVMAASRKGKGLVPDPVAELKYDHPALVFGRSVQAAWDEHRGLMIFGIILATMALGTVVRVCL